MGPVGPGLPSNRTEHQTHEYQQHLFTVAWLRQMRRGGALRGRVARSAPRISRRQSLGRRRAGVERADQPELPQGQRVLPGDAFGDRLVTSQDESWLQQRRFIQPSSTPKRVDGYAAVVAEEADRVAAQWRAFPSGPCHRPGFGNDRLIGIATRNYLGEDATRMFPVLKSTRQGSDLAAIRTQQRWSTPRARRRRQSRCTRWPLRRRSGSWSKSILVDRTTSHANLTRPNGKASTRPVAVCNL